jgi:YHS domain-containing protein
MTWACPGTGISLASYLALISAIFAVPLTTASTQPTEVMSQQPALRGRINLSCARCGGAFSHKVSDVVKRLRNGQSKLFCSPECFAVHKTTLQHYGHVCPQCGGEKKSAAASSCQACYDEAHSEATKVLVCSQCGTSFARTDSELRKAEKRGYGTTGNVFCSTECYRQFRVAQPKSPKTYGTCQHCGKSITSRHSTGAFCSRKCYHEHRATLRQSDAYAGAFLSLKSIVAKRDQYQCALCGSPKRLETHHIDMDATHNDISNLILLCNRCHSQVHGNPESAQPALQAIVDYRNTL